LLCRVHTLRDIHAIPRADDEDMQEDEEEKEVMERQPIRRDEEAEEIAAVLEADEMNH
jgi:hypothetical protein